MLNEKSKSKTQQRLFGMASAYKAGKLDTKDISDELLDKIKSIASNMSKDDIDKYAKTKHDDLPEKVPENHVPMFEEFLNLKK